MTNKDYNDCVFKYADDVYRFVYHNCNDEMESKDIVQEAFVSLWENYKQLDKCKTKSYLFSTAYHLVNSRYRHAKVVQRHQQQIRTECIQYSDSRYESQDYLYKALEGLPKIQKSALLLKDLEGYSYKEIGALLELTNQQVQVYIFRARVALRKELTKMEVMEKIIK